MNVTAEMVRQLRENTGAGMMDCKTALVEAKGDSENAREILRKKGLAAAARKAGRSATEGLVGTYIHPGNKIGVLVEINCETDFVARTPEFQSLVKNVAMHIAASSPQYVSKDQVPQPVLDKEREIYRAQAAGQGKAQAVAERIAEGKLKDFFSTYCLLEQPYIRDGKLTVGQLVQETIALLKENIVVRRFSRFKVGEDFTSDAIQE
ncbi:MAG: translation elongation factor Ts [Vicinamibacteria bacterium]|nr:translation elongation factor Ts [Vicinamibacteria bacterium]